jgi:hypothetical protein
LGLNLNLAIQHIEKQFAGSLQWNELPQQHRASSNTSLQLDGIELTQFFGMKKKRKKDSKKLSQLRHVELANECESQKRNT